MPSSAAAGTVKTKVLASANGSTPRDLNAAQILPFFVSVKMEHNRGSGVPRSRFEWMSKIGRRSEPVSVYGHKVAGIRLLLEQEQFTDAPRYFSSAARI